jgi:hypothetical protein
LPQNRIVIGVNYKFGIEDNTAKFDNLPVPTDEKIKQFRDELLIMGEHIDRKELKTILQIAGFLPCEGHIRYNGAPKKIKRDAQFNV